MNAFVHDNVRTGVWGEKFNCFLPLIINPGISKKFETLKVLRECLTKMKGEKEWNAEYALQILPVLMNSVIVSFLKQSVATRVSPNICEKSLQAYCSFHYMLLALNEEDPALGGFVESNLKTLVREPSKLHHNLGDLLCAMVITNTSFDDVKKNLVREFIARRSSKYYSIWKSKTNCESKLDKIAAVLREDIQTFLFQVTFAVKFGKATTPQKMYKFYCRSYGRINLTMVTILNESCEKLQQQMTVGCLSSLYSCLALPLPTQQEFSKMFDEIVESRNVEGKSYL